LPAEGPRETGLAGLPVKNLNQIFLIC
jgi:hypothetical protein